MRDSSTVTISRIASFPVVIDEGTSNAVTIINHWNQLRLSEFFPNYSPMYDQMKLDRVYMKVTGSQAGTAVTANISPSVVTAFDRNGLSPGQVLSSQTVSTYSSAKLRQWSNGAAFTMVQQFSPSTMMEKSQYIPTDSLEDPTTVASSTNPCYNVSDATLPFRPLSFIAVDMGSNMTAQQTFAFTIEFEYVVTFRGMRKPSLNAATYSGIYYLSRFVYLDIGMGFGNSIYYLEDVSSSTPRYSNWLYVSSATTVSISPSQDLVAFIPGYFGTDVWALQHVGLQGSRTSESVSLPAGSYYQIVSGNAGTGYDDACVYYDGVFFAGFGVSASAATTVGAVPIPVLIDDLEDPVSDEVASSSGSSSRRR